MKTKGWIFIFGVILALCLGLSFLFLSPGQAEMAEIWSDGKLVRTVPLAVDQEFAVETADGVNTVTVKDGKIAVTAASCPDGYCMQRGWCEGGPQIVCLPNRLVIRFTGEAEVDAIS